ncbi:MAG: hypothetical protein R3A78_09515 [Polyangiales bacterium]
MTSPLHPFRGQLPIVNESAPLSRPLPVIGDVHVGAESSIWYGAVLRGDVQPIRVGARTSIQDNSVVHATSGLSPCTSAAT